MGVTTSVTKKTTPPTTPLDGGLGATRAAIGPLGTRTQAVVSLIALAARAAGTGLHLEGVLQLQAPATAATPAITPSMW